MITDRVVLTLPADGPDIHITAYSLALHLIAKQYPDVIPDTTYIEACANANFAEFSKAVQTRNSALLKELFLPAFCTGYKDALAICREKTEWTKTIQALSEDEQIAMCRHLGELWYRHLTTHARIKPKLRRKRKH